MKNIVILIALCLGFLFSCGSKQTDANSSSEALTNTDTKPAYLDDTKEKKEPIPAEQLAKAKEIVAAVSEDDIAAVDAKKLFKITCSICHGTTGNLNLNGASDLTKSTNSLEESVAQIYFGKGLMVPYKGTFSEAEIVALASFVGGMRK